MASRNYKKNNYRIFSFFFLQIIWYLFFVFFFYFNDRFFSLCFSRNWNKWFKDIFFTYTYFISILHLITKQSVYTFFFIFFPFYSKSKWPNAIQPILTITRKKKHSQKCTTFSQILLNAVPFHSIKIKYTIIKWYSHIFLHFAIFFFLFTFSYF